MFKILLTGIYFKCTQLNKVKWWWRNVSLFLRTSWFWSH